LPTSVLALELEVERVVGRSALVAFEGNRYSVAPGQAGRTVLVRRRLDDDVVRIYSIGGVLLAEHHRATPGAGVLVRTADHHALLEGAVLERFSTLPACRRTENRPPSAAALRAGAALRAAPSPTPRPLSEYAALVEAGAA
jgi:hypothetical protein